MPFPPEPVAPRHERLADVYRRAAARRARHRHVALGAIAAVMLLAASAAAVQIDRDPAPIGVVADDTGADTTEPAPDHEPQPEPTSTTTVDAEPTPEAPPTTEPAPDDADHSASLWGRSFASVRVTEGGQPRGLYPGTRIELRFGKARRAAGWNSGCSFFGGDVTITADRIELPDEAGAFVTGRGGGCDEELHQQDDWLSNFMASGPYWALDGGRLTLTSGDTVIEMQEAVDHGAPLWGRSFASVRVTEGGQPRDLNPGTRIELTFDEPWRAARWNAGCNYFGANVAITADRIEQKSHAMGSTAGCRGEHDHDQDDWLASFMASGPYWALDGDRLTLTSGDTVIEMQEAPPERQHP